MVLICEKYGWTYEQYMEQPNFFIELIIQKIKVDNQKEENISKKK